MLHPVLPVMLRSSRQLRGRRSRVGFAVVALRSFTVASAAEVAPLHIVFGGANIPHPEKLAKGGEDAFFCDDNTKSFGVADGVGGSASEDVDPGRFSREMLRQCHAALRAEPQLPLALRTASTKPITLGGSSTLLLGQLESSTNTLRVFNLGDSGAMLVRPAVRRFQSGNVMWPRIVLRSGDQSHFFNCPYQVAAEDVEHLPERMDEIAATVREGDVLIAATDGVLDNLHDVQIQTAIAQRIPQLHTSDPSKAQAAVDALADMIAKQAHEIGLREDDADVRTPFMVAAATEGMRFAGGKLDDVAVVCGVVRAGERPPRRMLDNFGGATDAAR
jgi:protein phosphatase PTC7